MKLINNILIIALVALLAASCSKSDLHGDKRLPAGEVSIQLALPSVTKADDPNQGTPAENYIGVTQFVLFAPTADQSGKVERVITVDTKQSAIIDMQTVWNAATQRLSLRGIDLGTPKSVYVIANATAANGYDPAAIKVGETTEKELLEAVTKLTQLTTPTLGGNGILMSGIAKSHDFKTSPALTVDLTRQLVKIKLTVKINQSFLAALPKVTFEDEQALSSVLLSLYNVPSHSFVNATTPATMPTESEMLEFSPIVITKSGSGSELKWEAEVYIYENLISGSTDDSRKASTWLLLRLPYKDNGTLVSDNYYKFYITNPNDAADPHKTVRNHIYDITATVTGFGGPKPSDGKDAFVTTTVLPWNVVNLPDKELGGYLKFLKITTADETFTLTDGDYISAGETIKAHCKTNVGEWYALTYRENESTYIHKSIVTDVISSSTVQSVDIVIPTTTMDIIRYTIKLYHPKIAPESGEPFKTLTLNQSSGVIPNSVLIKPFRIKNGYYDGWPVDKLPPRGLQVNKRGNHPAMVKPDDPIAKWSSEKIETKTERCLGCGRTNRDKIFVQIGFNAGKYPAYNECVSIGSGQQWYLPSIYELMMIYVHRGLLSSSFAFSEDKYWSSSEIANNGSYYVYFVESSTPPSYIGKQVEYRIRCVSDI